MAKPTPQPDLAATRPDHHGPTVGHPKDKRPLRWRRRLLRLTVFLLLLVVVLVVAGPKLLSTGPGTKVLLWAVNSRIDGTVDAQDVSLAWFSGLSADGVAYTSGDGMHHVTAGHIDAPDTSVWDLVRGRNTYGRVSVRDLHGLTTEPEPRKPERDPASSDNPADASSGQGNEPDGPAVSRWAAGLTLDLVVDGVTWRYEAGGIEPVDVVSSRLSVGVPGGGEVRVQTDGAVKQAGESGQFEIDVTAHGLVDLYGEMQPMQADYAADVSLQQLPVDALSRFVAGRQYTNPALRYLLGSAERVSSVLGGRWLALDLDAAGKLNQLNATLRVHSANLDADLVLVRDEQGLSASPDSTLHWDMTPNALAALSPASGLVMDRAVSFTSRQMVLVLPRSGDGFDWDQVEMRAVVRADDWQMQDAEGRRIGLREFRLGVVADALGDELAVVMQSPVTLTEPGEGRSLEEDFSLTLKYAGAFSAEPVLTMRSQAVPVVLADALFGYDGMMVMWLGWALNLDATVTRQRVEQPDGTTQTSYRYGLVSSSDQISGSVDGAWAGQTLSGATAEDEAIAAVLSPEAFAWLMGMVTRDMDRPWMTVDEPMPVFVTVRRASVTPQRGRVGEEGAFWDASQTVIEAEIELTPAAVYDPRRDHTYELRSGTVTITPQGEPGQFDINADLELWVPPNAGAAGVMATMRMEVSGFDVADSRGGIPRDMARLREVYGADGVVSLENMPSSLLDGLVNGEGGLAAALGPIVQNMDLQLDIEGGQARGATMQLNWDTDADAPIDNAHASMRPVEMDIDEDGVMTVADGQDIELELRVTEDLGDHWLGQLHPVLFDAKSADRPVRVVIDGGSFRYPLGDLTMAGANIDAMVDLGSVQFGEDSLLGQIVDWTGHDGERAVFDPARVTIRDGLISYSELALSVGNVQLSFDGSIDLVEQTVSDMAIRVPAESLMRVFPELDGVIETEDELLIPMTGPIRQPSVATEAFRAEVVRLLSRRPRERVEREAGQLIDQVRDAVGGEAGDEAAAVVEGVLRQLLGGGRD